MINSHVHCRDWTSQWHKETIRRALCVARRVGSSAIFDMPNTIPPITSTYLAVNRLNYAADSIEIMKSLTGSEDSMFYGLYLGVTPDAYQIDDVVEAHRRMFLGKDPDLYSGVVGLKMFAGKSVGDLAVVEEDEQRMVYRTLTNEGFDGVLAVHCEKEKLMKPNLWDPDNPKSHSYVRSEEAEIESVRDQIKFAEEAGFPGTLHILHLSTPGAMELVEGARAEGRIKITCEAAPHHFLLSTDDIPESEYGLIYKVNPPIRSPETQKKNFENLMLGRYDVIGFDHAPHTLEEKTGYIKNENGDSVYMSGIPGLPFAPHLKRYLKSQGFSDEQIDALTHHNINRLFGLEIPLLDIEPDLEQHKLYDFDAYNDVRSRI